MRSSSPIERLRSGSPSVLRKALGLGPRDWSDLAVACLELGIARVRLAMSDRATLLRPSRSSNRPSREQDVRVERVRSAIARASHRVPWRAECLVQAVAARHWLRRHAVETSLCIGVPDRARGQFEAHAWLMHGERVVTGGDIREYAPLLNGPADAEREPRKN